MEPQNKNFAIGRNRIGGNQNTPSVWYTDLNLGIERDFNPETDFGTLSTVPYNAIFPQGTYNENSNINIKDIIISTSSGIVAEITQKLATNTLETKALSQFKLNNREKILYEGSIPTYSGMLLPNDIVIENGKIYELKGAYGSEVFKFIIDATIPNDYYRISTITVTNTAGGISTASVLLASTQTGKINALYAIVINEITFGIPDGIANAKQLGLTEYCTLLSIKEIW